MYHSGEYLVIQTYPISRKLKVTKRTFNYQEARSDCEIENLAHDYSHYSLRMYREGKLWDLNSDGTPDDLSEEQFWDIHPDYETAYWRLRSRLSNNGQSHEQEMGCHSPSSREKVKGKGNPFQYDWFIDTVPPRNGLFNGAYQPLKAPNHENWRLIMKKPRLHPMSPLLHLELNQTP